MDSNTVLKTSDLLDKPVDPERMMEAVMEDINGGNYADLARTSSKHIRESWQAAKLGIGYKTLCQSCEIKVLSGTKQPDFYLIHNVEEHAFENRELLSIGRKRGDELGEADRISGFNASIVRFARRDDIMRNRLQLPIRIREVIYQKKATVEKGGFDVRKHNLCIYLNIDLQATNLEVLRTRLNDVKGIFNSVWLIEREHVATLFMRPESTLMSTKGFVFVGYEVREKPILHYVPEAKP